MALWNLRMVTAVGVLAAVAFAPSIGRSNEFDDEHDVVDSSGDVHYSDHAHDNFHARPDSHAPSGLGADHAHDQGEWMVEYKYMYMNMQNMLNGTTRVAPGTVPPGFTATPRDMNMMMHMGHVMYGLTDNITLYTMFMWTENRMDHLTGGGMRFRTENSDFDDMVIGAVLNLYETSNSEWIGHIGFTIPTGDIGQEVIPGPPPPPGKFPYPMRTGSGHVAIRPSLTYKHWNDSGSIGIQALTTVPLHENYRGYTEGEEVQVSFWYSHLLTEKVSGSFRIEGYWRDDFLGADPELVTTLVTTNRPDFQGRSNLNLYGGLNAIVCGGHRLAIEVGTPVYQNVQGFQLEQDLFLTTSWSKAY